MLSRYLNEGLNDGRLPKTVTAIDEAGSVGTGRTKPTFNYPRPYLPDRSFAGQPNPSQLNGLQPSLNIDKVPDWGDPAHTASYDAMLKGYSQAFPSGHTTYAVATGTALAQLLPQLGPEILTRASEAGNNRIVLGVHYPLDVEGGRILGQANNSYLWSSAENFSTVLQPAATELQNYLASRCKADSLSETLAECITKTGANADKGYTNFFTDVVSTTAVTDRTTAISAYQARMTYGFGQTGTAGQKAVVPDGAESLLATTFPTLDPTQRRAVLAATEIDSGFPLDAGSQGWQRIDLAAAMSAKVTVDASGTVTAVEPGQAVASVVTAAPSPSASPSVSVSSSPSASVSSVSPSVSSSPSVSVSSSPSVSVSSASPSASVASSSVVSSAGLVSSGGRGRAASVLGLPLTGAGGVEGLVGLAVVLSGAVGGLFAVRRSRRR
ncbi:PAP2 superfamily protein [Propionibacterium cyclohexanicum]|uniref:PAP2 superfamily protein n=1 Tax=Propionibacterium cyclohexanicum TaxID=64702 RepID=A0A1H9Q549_9ACTN|nr:phosphatase PAP2 family protein [Propionibacterium cyclohexanicum]SER55567.1 PAP2 superfamily protein [Propionibacterium cyclohexanicum]